MGLPAAGQSRIVVLFCALAWTKPALFVGLSKHRYELHWRVSREAPSLRGWLVLYTFPVLAPSVCRH
jgi:hypothetical protein